MTNQDEGKQFPCNFLGDIYDICMLSTMLFCKHTHHKEYMRTTQGIYASDIDSFEKSHIGFCVFGSGTIFIHLCHALAI